VVELRNIIPRIGLRVSIDRIIIEHTNELGHVTFSFS
jgi:hypothetical protein